MHKLKKILFVAYDFPPCDNVGGSLRSEYFVRYLRDFGWEPVIVSLGSRPVQERYENVFRVRSITPWHWPYEVTPYGWIIPLRRRIKLLVKDNSFDIIYVSCPPFVHTGSISKLKNSLGLPLILDFRDAWSLDPYVEGSKLKKFLYRHGFPGWEKKIFNDADRILVNTQSVLAGYRALYPRLAGRFSILPNGFDEGDFNEMELPRLSNGGPLTVVHVGRFGIGNRDPAVIFDALRILKKDGIELILKIIGDPVGKLGLRAAEEGLTGMVQVEPAIPHAEALAKLCSCDVALLYQESSRSRVSAVAGKTHEYLRAGKPILAIAPPGDNLNLIREMAGWYRAIPQPADAQSIAAELRRLVELKSRGKLPVYSPAKQEYIEQYSRRALTAALAKQFEVTLESL